MSSKSRRIPNVYGAARGPLNTVSFVDTSKGFVANAEKNAPAQQKALVKDILLAIKQFVADSDKHQLDLDAKLSDIVLGRIASLLDEVKENFVENELEEVKKEILDEISGISISSVLKSFLLNQVAEIFDSDAKKEDIEELKAWMQKNLVEGKSDVSQPSPSSSDEDETIIDNDEQTAEDNEKGEYKDSTPAENFFVLQAFIQHQFDQLNENLKNIPGQSGIFSKINTFISNGFAGISKKVSSLGKFVAKSTTSVFKGIGKIGGALKSGAFAAIGGIATRVASLSKGISGIVSGIKGLGSRIGSAIASPFKKIGGFLSELNPFKKKDKKEEKRQKLKDKIMEKISVVIEKIWKVIEPFIDKVLLFMRIAVISVIIPIATTLATVLMILTGIVLLTIGAILAYKWITAKISQFWNYIVSGEMWEDIKSGLLKAFEWMADFSKWLWDIIVDALHYIFVGMWVDLGKWIWEKLTKFGKWLYDNYIDKYIIQPLTRLIQPLANIWVEKIQPIVQPFIDSLTSLKDNIVQAFSAWDTSKSIWDNLKNIGGILKDTIVAWWQNDNPFKSVYNQYILPIFADVKNFIDRVKSAFSFWDASKPLSENLKDIGTILIASLTEWWENSSIKKIWTEKISPFVQKIAEKLKDLTKPLVEWYEKSKLKEWIDKIVEMIKPIAEMITGLFNKIVGPIKKVVAKTKKAITGVDESTLAQNQHGSEWGKVPDGFAKISSVAEADAQIARINKMLQNGTIRTEDGKAVAAKSLAFLEQKRKQLAEQQVSSAMKPIQELDAMQSKEQQSLVEDSKEISTEIEKKEEAQQQFNAVQSDKSEAMLCEIRALRKETKDTLKDPYVVPFPVLQNGNYNYATMEEN